MSYDTHEPLADIIKTLKGISYPGLKRMLDEGGDVPLLHPTVEMLASLIARYDRGEIVERAT